MITIVGCDCKCQKEQKKIQIQKILLTSNHLDFSSPNLGILMFVSECRANVLDRIAVPKLPMRIGLQPRLYQTGVVSRSREKQRLRSTKLNILVNWRNCGQCGLSKLDLHPGERTAKKSGLFREEGWGREQICGLTACLKIKISGALKE